jgi:alkylated DNA repair dioxygenase AlkB
METIKILPTEKADQLLIWAKAQQFEREVFTGRETCRLKKWWGYEAEFYFDRSHVYPRQTIESDNFLASYRDQLAPLSDSVLLYYYQVGGTIGEHLDKKCFDKWVTLINLVDAEADLFGNRPATKFRWSRVNYELHHGEVVRFDSRVLHSVPPLKSARYSLQFRNIAF